MSSSGQQPMLSADGNVCLTFNGEIFNYIELREAMILRGHRFRTDSDTEVILKLYEEKGVDFVDDLNGDFAFAIWDKRETAPGDGARPHGCPPALLHTPARAALYFASEVKALLTVPGIARRARSDCARPDLHLLVSAVPAHAIQGNSRTAAGACADRAGRQRHSPPATGDWSSMTPIRSTNAAKPALPKSCGRC